MSDAWRMRDFAQLAVSALGVRRLRARSPEAAAALLEVELLLLAAWDVREAIAAAGEGGVPVKPLLDPGLRRIRDALWTADAAIAVREASLHPRSAASASNLLVETLFVLTAWALPNGVEVDAADDGLELRLVVRYRAQATGEPDFAQLRRDVASLGGRLDAAAAADGFLVSVAI